MEVESISILRKDFRELLQDELISRCRKNPSYSLRAFAKSLNIGSSSLSKLLHKKRNLSKSMLMKLANRLELDPSSLTNYAHNLRGSKKEPTGKEILAEDYREILSDSFQLISDWYPLAILELSRCKGFKTNPRWIAKRLGLTLNQVNIAVQRLRRVGLLEISNNGKWIPCVEGTTSIYNESTDIARRRHQRQILERAILALENVPVERRDQTAMLMAVNSKRMKVAKERIKKFRRSLCAFMENGGPRDEVYYLSVSLFPVTTTLKRGKHETMD
jgi:uncharacterized protein (TIGR02147 family)